jgi:hypothetical protein
MWRLPKKTYKLPKHKFLPQDIIHQAIISIEIRFFFLCVVTFCWYFQTLFYLLLYIVCPSCTWSVSSPKTIIANRATQFLFSADNTIKKIRNKQSKHTLYFLIALILFIRKLDCFLVKQLDVMLFKSLERKCVRFNFQ